MLLYRPPYDHNVTILIIKLSPKRFHMLVLYGYISECISLATDPHATKSSTGLIAFNCTFNCIQHHHKLLTIQLHQVFVQNWHLHHSISLNFSTLKSSLSKIILLHASQTDQIIAKKHTHHCFFRRLLNFTSIQDSKAHLGFTGNTIVFTHTYMVKEKDVQCSPHSFTTPQFHLVTTPHWKLQFSFD